MADLKTYDLFISHAWRYSESYYRLIAMLDNAPNFKWRNYSVPRHDPVLDPSDPSDQQILMEKLKEQIRPVNCVLVISGMYVAHKFWIQKEIDMSLNYGKPIIGIVPWSQERIPTEVSSVAEEMVGWNTSSIINAIREYSI